MIKKHLKSPKFLVLFYKFLLEWFFDSYLGIIIMKRCMNTFSFIVKLYRISNWSSLNSPPLQVFVCWWCWHFLANKNFCVFLKRRLRFLLNLSKPDMKNNKRKLWMEVRKKIHWTYNSHWHLTQRVPICHWQFCHNKV